MIQKLQNSMHLMLLLSFVTLWAPLQAGDPKANAEQVKQVRTLYAEFIAAADEPARTAAIGKIIELGRDAVALVSPLIDSDLENELSRYGKVLEPAARSAYLKKLDALSDEQIDLIARTRILWKPYVLNGGQHAKFREVYLGPIWKMKEFLLPTISEIDDAQVIATRTKLMEYATYQERFNKVLGKKADPTIGKKSPTNIEYAPLDQPQTFADRLHHFERTLILINSVASPGARDILLMNDQSAREIDVQEAEYVMVANEVRMLAGSIAWQVDPLGCAVTRDHSNDRKEGRASGHMSDVPGKRGFSDRNKRMGARHFGAEGAGGGKDGPSYLIGLSYSGDGHGGPLYRLFRNIIGVGRRGGVYTSQYATDSKLVHPCPATDNEMWMPPGIIPSNLRDPAVQGAFKAMKAEAFANAFKTLERVKSANKPPKGVDAVAARFFMATITAQCALAVDEVSQIEKTGDLYNALATLTANQAKYKGIPLFENGVSESITRLTAKEIRPEINAGEAYHRIYHLVKDLPKEQFDANRKSVIKNLEAFARKYKDSVYSKAATDAVTRLAIPESDARALMAFFTGLEIPKKATEEEAPQE